MLSPPRGAAPAALLLVLAAAPAPAQVLIALTRSGSGARAAGMANAFVGVSDDGTAASWNPAGLAQLRKPELSAVYSVSPHALRITGERSQDDRFAFTNHRFGYTNSSLDFASLALPFQAVHRPVTVQLGWQRLYQLGGSLTGDVVRLPLVDPAEPARSISVNNALTGQIDIVSLAGAVKVTGRTSLGGSLNIYRGRWSDRNSLAESVGSESAFSSITNHNRIRGHNFSAGLLLTYPRWNAGLVYHSPFWSSYSLDTERRSSGEPTGSADAGGSARFRFPRNMAAGIAWRPALLWTVAADATHDQWTDAIVDRMRGQTGAVNFFDGLPPALSTTRDTLTFSLGMEHLFPREGSVVPLRMGFAWEPQGPMDPVTRDPVNYLMLSAGSGYNSNRLKFDVALQYRWSGFQSTEVLSVETTEAGGLNRDAVGHVASREWRFKFSLIYRILETRKVKDLVGRIFG